MAKVKTIEELSFELENTVTSLVSDHGYQWGEVIFRLYGYMMVHLPEGREEYEDGTHPELMYAHRDHTKWSNNGE